MSDYYIIGSGGLAKELLSLTKYIHSKNFSFEGFIDFNPNMNSKKALGEYFTVLDEDEFLKNHIELDKRKEINILNGVGDPSRIPEIVKKYDGFNFPNIIHPNFNGDLSTISMGEGNLIAGGSTFTCDIEVGSFNIINLNTTIGHDVKIGNYNVINPGTNISGSVHIGDSNLLGTSSTILQGLKLGNNNLIGANSLMTKNLEDNSKLVTLPSKQVE